MQEQYVKNHKRASKKITSKTRDQTPKCNCRKKTECPMEGNCQINDLVYKCEVIKPLHYRKKSVS